MEDNSLEVETTNDVREIIELNDAHQEIEAFDAEIETTVQDAEVIQNVQEVVAKAAEGEGLSPASAELAEVVLESLYGRLGIPKKSIMSLEAYGDPKQRRKTITRVACEDIKDTLVRIWTALKEAFAKAWQNIKMFIAKIFSSVKMARTEIDRMKEKLNGLSDVELKPIAIEHVTLCKAFSIDGEADAKTVDYIMHNHYTLADQSSRISKGCRSFLNKLTVLSGSWSAKDFDAHGRLDLIHTFEKNVVFLRQEIFPLTITVNKHEGHFVAPRLVNSHFFGVITPFKDDKQRYTKSNDGETIDWAIMSSDLTPVLMKEQEDKIADKIQTASKEHIEALLTNLVSLCDKLDKMQHAQTDINEFEKDIQNLFTRTIANLQKQSPDIINHTVDKTITDIVRYGSTAISRTYGLLIAKLPQLTFEAIRHSLNYIRVSLQQVEEPKAA